ncbi:MAG: TetR/AcrR family transcriptional regulator [Pseudomonadota bacterium]
MSERDQPNLNGVDWHEPREKILKAARDLFFRYGFAGITTRRLASAARVSKSSIYKYFSDMPGILKAVAEQETAQTPFNTGIEAQSAEAFRVHLVEQGADLIRMIEQPEKVQFDRLVHEQARAHPDLAEIYFQTIYVGTLAGLTRLIADGQDLGFVPGTQSASILAEQLLMMWQGLPGVQHRLGLKPTAADMPLARSRAAVDTILGRSST